MDDRTAAQLNAGLRRADPAIGPVFTDGPGDTGPLVNLRGLTIDQIRTVSQIIDAPAAGRQATLDDLPPYTESTIGTMEPGDSGYAVPWAMYAGKHGLLWLYPDFEIHRAGGGTLRMRIERRVDGYHVWPVRGQRYHPGSGKGRSAPVAVIENS